MNQYTSVYRRVYNRLHKMRLRHYFLLSFVALLVILMISPKYRGSIMRVLRSDLFSRTSPPPVDQDKTILLWTPFFGTKDYMRAPKKLGCPETRCTITSDRNLLPRSHAIVFHHTDIKLDDIPKERQPWQRWVYLNHESSAYTRRDLLAGLEDKFNWTITYRLDSDMFLSPMPKLRKVPLVTQRTDFSKGKNKMAAWFVSNCKTKSNREEYVERLRKVVPVDIYGGCGTMQCQPRMSNRCYEQVAKEYWFYLSFENSICRDYVTEKFFNVLNHDMVPVVLGGTDYTRVAPPNSFINALNFSSPEELGAHLLRVSKSPELYNKFFQWRGTYEMDIPPYACQLCDKLHKRDEPRKVISDLAKWWFEEGPCTTWQA